MKTPVECSQSQKESLSEMGGVACIPLLPLVMNLVILFVLLLSVSCNRSERDRKRVDVDYQRRLAEMVKSGVVAGPGEKTFEEGQGVKLHLPMPENEFIELLKRLNLEFYDDGEQVIPDTDWKRDAIDKSQIRRAYEILGKVDREHQFHEAYRAWVDKNGDVVYIENAFVYTNAP